MPAKPGERNREAPARRDCDARPGRQPAREVGDAPHREVARQVVRVVEDDDVRGEARADILDQAGERGHCSVTGASSASTDSHAKGRGSRIAHSASRVVFP